MKASEKHTLDFQQLKDFVDNIYDEICVWDSNNRIFYINKACYRHYGLKPDELIGKSLEDLTGKEKLWSPTCVPDTKNEKKPFIQRQSTFMGIDIVTISVPIFDENGDVKYIVQSVRDSEESLYKELSPVEILDDAEPLNNCVVYQSSAMRNLMAHVDKIAKTKASILILGETGTGKSRIARYIHETGAGKDKPFVSINMASMNPSLIESEFFGYSDGAFTGARKGGRKGLLEASNGGTLFLDEIGEFPLDLQAKFLHVLQDSEFTPVGSTKPIKLNTRIICATNCDISLLIEAGKFRQDLYHRINLFEIMVPGLEKRKEDIPVLASYFLKQFNEKYECNNRISDEVLSSFMGYGWPGNIRELSNVIERAVITCDNGVIEMADLPDSFFSVDNLETNLGEESKLNLSTKSRQFKKGKSQSQEPQISSIL